MSRSVIGLASRAALDPDNAGGKGAGLARLVRGGQRVPEGFIVTAAALDRVGDGAGLPAGPARDIGRALARLGGPVAVRSSMVGEDSSTASYAGQLDTFLNVSGVEAVIGAVRQCRDSAAGGRVRVYEARFADARGGERRCAVVVQRMVDARAAGVAFSADPLTGAHNVVIEAAAGLGTAVVDGRRRPDRYVVDGRGALVEVRAAGDEPLLDEKLVLEIARATVAVAARAGVPQDVEWAWDGQELFLLQARPISSLAGRHVYSNRIVADMSPGLVKPLVWSTKTLAKTENVFRPIFEQLLGRTGFEYGTIVRRVRSRVYADMTVVGELMARVGLPMNALEMVTRDERARRAALKPSLRLARSLLRLAALARRFARSAPQIRRFLDERGRELEDIRRTDQAGLDEAGLLGLADRLMALHGRSQWWVFVGPMTMAVQRRLMERLLRERAPGVSVADLLRPGADTAALGPNRALERIARLLPAHDSEARQAAAAGDDAAARAALARSAEGRALLAEFDAFLCRFGFLSANGSDFTEVPWVEDPRLLWQAVARLAGRPGRARETVDCGRAAARARERLGPARGRLFDRLLRGAAEQMELRERVSLVMSEESYLMRRAFLSLGALLCRRGVLRQADDVFFLYLDELRAVAAGRVEPGAAQSLVEERRNRLDEDSVLEPPDTMSGEEAAGAAPPPAAGEFLVGIAGSSGVARGRARLVTEPARAPAGLGERDILVVPFTDVGWTPLFPGIGGLVAETGGQLSHSSIVAREYGIPAVVSVRGAMRAIREGQSLTVDGSRGRVYLGPMPGEAKATPDRCARRGPNEEAR